MQIIDSVPEAKDDSNSVPEAKDDSNSVTEDEDDSNSVTEDEDDSNSVTEDEALTASGNVITAGPGADELGADPTTVTGVAAGKQPSAAGGAGTEVIGEHGKLVLDPDGRYIYTLDNDDPAVQRLIPGQSLEDVFTYTITDSDGDPSTATVTITIHGTNDGECSLKYIYHESLESAEHGIVSERLPEFQGQIDPLDLL